MHTVWKYELPVSAFGSAQAVPMQRDAEILYAEYDPNGLLCVWAKVDPEFDQEDRMIIVVGTGHVELSDSAVYISTIVGEPLVLHVFEER